MENIIFTDYRISSSFLAACQGDVLRLKCGRRIQGETMQCLAEQLGKVASDQCRQVTQEYIVLEHAMKPPPELENLSQEDKEELQRLSQTMLQLCRGEEFTPLEEKSKLLCRYSSGKHSFLLIGPMKEEEVYLNPRIVLYHDFLTPREIETIKDMATPRFKRATVQNYLTGELETANYRLDFILILLIINLQTIQDIQDCLAEGGGARACRQRLHQNTPADRPQHGDVRGTPGLKLRHRRPL